jgi:phenylalanyl-tRNA synthetase beta chain
MRISLNWLKQYLELNIEPEKIAAYLTDCGLEVEKIEHTGISREKMEGLVIGKVVERSKHPDADRLSLTKVDVGIGELLDIVCGAPNVDAGQKVVVATVGATLYPSSGEPFKIKRSKIRGAVSEGMICAEDEIGVGESHDGIMVLPEDTKIGIPAIEYFGESGDTCFEIGLTPNRVDAASHFGVARDLAAVLNARENSSNHQAKLPNVDINFSEHISPKIEIKDTEKCPRYAALVVSDAKVAPSPDWLQERLRAIGLKPINNIVDITNFVLHETGHPLHAFDFDKLEGGGIRIQTLHEGTSFVTLDEVERKLSAEDLMICDLKDNPLCIAGVFGGLHSGVTDNTTTVLIESAYFNPVSVRKTAKRHGLNTDASFRFERGADLEMIPYALMRAAQLMVEIAGAKIASPLCDEFPFEIEKSRIQFEWKEFKRYAGFEVSSEKLTSILEDLDFEVDNEVEFEGVNLTVPLYRVDVTRPCDLVEELMRVIGYNEIPFPEKLNASLSYRINPDKHQLKELVSEFLSSRGFAEIMCNSLTSKKHLECIPDRDASSIVEILNPLSNDLNVLRSSLLFNGLESIRYNINRKNDRIKFYEFGHTYRKDGERYLEDEFIGLFISGDETDLSWMKPQGSFNFFDLKTEVYNTLSRIGVNPNKLQEKQINQAQHELWVSLSQGKTPLAEMGKVNKKLLQHFEIDKPVFYAQLHWDNIIASLKVDHIRFKSIPKYPEVRRDFSLLLDKSIQFSEIERVANQKGGNLLRSVHLFDVYEGKNLPEGKKSYAVSFILRDDSATLTDEIVDQVMNAIRSELEQKLAAELR